MCGYRIIIPKSLRNKLLGELHAHHFGIVKTKSLARSYIYWSDLDKEIEKKCKSCIHCLWNRQAPTKSELMPWKLENSPWKRIHMDFCGPINGNMFLVVVDAYSKWMERTPHVSYGNRSFGEIFWKFARLSVLHPWSKVFMGSKLQMPSLRLYDLSKGEKQRKIDFFPISILLLCISV